MAETSALPAPESYWVDTAPGPDRTSGSVPDEVDVMVLSAGITGLTTAFSEDQDDLSSLSMPAA